MRIIVLMLAIALTSACSVLSESKTAEVTPQETPPTQLQVVKHNVCWFTHAPEGFPANCDVRFWVNLWLDADSTPWSERKEAIAQLGKTEEDKLRQFFLTLPTDTPYQDKLRAQLALDDITDQFTELSKTLLLTIAVKPNKQQMELESAMSVLSKENAHNALALKSLQKELDAQQRKLEELLQIEATLMDKSRSNQQ